MSLTEPYVAPAASFVMCVTPDRVTQITSRELLLPDRDDDDDRNYDVIAVAMSLMSSRPTTPAWCAAISRSAASSDRAARMFERDQEARIKTPGGRTTGRLVV